MKNRIGLVWCFFAITLMYGCNSTSKKTEKTSDSTEVKKPNFIIFFTDDQGYADVGTYGAEGFKTPNLDKLAHEGVSFTNFYVPASVCTPSRAAILTGLYPKKVGLHEAVIYPYSTNGLDPKETIIPEVLKPLGYTSACIGKWHLGHEEKYMPNNQGFDYFYGVPYSNDMDGYVYKSKNYTSPPLPIYENKELVASGTNQDSLTYRWTEKAVSYIKQNKEKPFLLYLAHNMPHLPWHASDNFKGSSEKGLYGDVIQEIDWSMGEIMKALKENGLDENTVVIFTSDNGPVTRVANGGSAKPYRGSKATTWEGGLRVPCIIRWPNKIQKNKVIDELTTSMDFMPTIASIAGGIKMDSKQTDGFDISNMLFSDKDVKSEYDAFYYYGRNGYLEAIKEGDWKLHIKKFNPFKRKMDTLNALYNLKEDAGEAHNVIDKHPELAARLLKKMLAFDKDLDENYNTAKTED